MEYPKAQRSYFTKRLMEWHGTANKRVLPWKQEKEPYRIWLSEVILQQTRAEQGLPYYLRFIEQYPTIQDLAKAEDEEVFRLWQGLGYYNRCRNLLTTARFINSELGGVFPSTYNNIRALKGVGDYTAAAVASFAYGLPHAVVDGNVNRVLARYFGIEVPTDSTEGKKNIAMLANDLLDRTDSAGFNQAIMDLGATICKPALPDCEQCPLVARCFAYSRGLTAELPLKRKKIKLRERYFHYILLRNEDRLWIHKRTGRDIWADLYQPLLVEHDRALSAGEVEAHPKLGRTGLKLIFEDESRQRLTHQLIHTRFFSAPVSKNFQAPHPEGEWVQVNKLKKYPFPLTLVSFFKKKVYF